MPEENASATASVYYTGKFYSDISAFKQSEQYEQFRQQYLLAIDDTIKFYLDNETDDVQKENVASNLKKLKEKIFGEQTDDVEKHSLFTAKKSMEQIAQALNSTEGISKTEKLVAIHNLAYGQADQEVGCLVCGPGIARNLVETALLLAEGDLFDNVLIKRRTIFHDVIQKYALRNLPKIYRLVGDHSHDTNIINAFMNVFSEEGGFSRIPEPFISESVVTQEDRENIRRELQQAITPESITNKLAIDYLNKINQNITKDEDGSINFQSASDAMNKFEKRYGQHNFLDVFIVDDNSLPIKVTTDPTAIKVNMARYFSAEIKNRPDPVNMFPLQWPEEKSIKDDGKGKQLRRIGDLLWIEQINDEGEKTIILPRINDLGEQYINEISNRRLQAIIQQTLGAEEACVLSKINPEKLNTMTTSELSLFFSRLDATGGMDNTIKYVTENEAWFKARVEKNNHNPLFDLIMKRLSTFEQLLQVNPDIALYRIKGGNAYQFFLMLDSGYEINEATDYAMKYKIWFQELVERENYNPLLDLAISRFPPDRLMALRPEHIAFLSIGKEQAKQFLSALDSDGGVDNAVKYATKNEGWFKSLVGILNCNPLFLLIMERHTPEILFKLRPDIALFNLESFKIRHVLSLLDIDGTMHKAIQYATNYREWFEHIVNEGKHNPLYHLAINRLTAEQRYNIEPGIVLYGITKQDADNFFQSLGGTDKALQYASNHEAWFKALVRSIKDNPLTNSVMKNLTTVEQRLNINPDIVLYGAEKESVYGFLSLLDSDGGIDNAVEFATKNKVWFKAQVAKEKTNPLFALMKKRLTPAQLTAFKPNSLALLGITVDQARNFFSKMSMEGNQNNAEQYLKDNPEFAHRIFPQVESPHSGNRPALSEGALVDTKRVSDWEMPVVKPQAEGGASRFAGQLIIQLENDDVVRDAAAHLVAKHPDTSLVIQLDAEGHWRVVYGDLNVLAGTTLQRWQLVGHGRGGENELNHQTLGGRTAEAVAKQLSQFRTDSAMSTHPEYISLVGCSSVGDEAENSYAYQFAKVLDEQGIRADIGARRVQLSVDEMGRKLTRDSEGQWQHKISEDKRVLSWNTAGELVPATDLSVRLPQVIALMESLKSNRVNMHQLDARQKQILADFFPSPEGTLNHGKVIQTWMSPGDYQRWATAAEQLQQTPDIHPQLTGLTGEQALQRSLIWATEQQKAFDRLITLAAAGADTDTNRPQMYPAVQRLYLSSPEGARGLGLAWLHARSTEGDTQAHRFLAALDTYAKINEQKALGSLSTQDNQQVTEFRQHLDALSDIKLQDEIATKQLALKPDAQGQYNVATGEQLIQAGQRILLLSDRLQTGQRHYYLYDPNAGEVCFDGEAAHEARDLAVTKWVKQQGEGVEVWLRQMNSAQAAVQSPVLNDLQALLTDFHSEQSRMLAAPDVALNDSKVPPLNLALMGATVDGKPLTAAHLNDPALTMKLRFDADTLLRYLTTTDHQEAATREALRFLTDRIEKGDTGGSLFSGGDDNTNNSALAMLRDIDSQHMSRLSTGHPQAPGRFLTRLNTLSDYGSKGMQGYGYLSGLRRVLHYHAVLGNDKLREDERKELLFQRDLAIGSLAVNGGVDLTQAGLGKLVSYNAKIINKMAAAPSSRLGKMLFKGGGTRLARFAGPMLGMLSSGFDFYDAATSFSQLATTTDPKARQDLIVNGSFAIIGGVTSIALPVAGILLAGTPAAALLGPVGLVIVGGLIVGQSIYQAVRAVEEIEKYRPLSAGERGETGFRIFLGLEPRPGIVNDVVRKQSEEFFRPEIDKQLKKQAEEFQDTHRADIVFYSRGKLRPLKEGRYKKITGRKLKERISKLTIGPPTLNDYSSEQILQDKILPEEAQKILNEYDKSISNIDKGEKKYRDLKLQESEFSYFLADGIDGVDDKVDANLPASWSNSDTVRLSSLRGEHQLVGQLVDSEGNNLCQFIKFHSIQNYTGLLGDFNGNGHQDIAYFSEYPNTSKVEGLYLLLANGQGSFTQPRFIAGVQSKYYFGTHQPQDLLRLVGDVNNDGRADIVILAGNIFNEFNLRILLAQPEGEGFITTEQMIPYLSDYITGTSAVLADIDGDGYADLLNIEKDEIYVSHGQKNGKFIINSEYYMILDSKRNHTLAAQLAGDINGDGRADVVLVRQSGNVTILLGGASRKKKFTQESTQYYQKMAAMYQDGYKLKQLQLNDMNGDGRADLVAIDNDGYYQIAYGQETGKLSEMSADNQPRDENGVAIAYRPNRMTANGQLGSILGITGGADGHQALLSYQPNGEVSAHSFERKKISETTVWFKLGDGDDEAIGQQGRKNIFEVGAGIKRFIGAELDDSFLLMGHAALPNKAALDLTLLDGGAGEDSVVAMNDAHNYWGYYINLQNNTLAYSDISTTYMSDERTAEEILPDVNIKGRIARIRSIEHAQGYVESNDILVGNDKDNRLNGAGGHDYLVGNGGNDRLTLQAGRADGGSGLDTYHILQNTTKADVILYEVAGETSNVLLDYDARSLQPLIRLEKNDVVLSFSNGNGTQLRLKNAYKQVESGSDQQKVLQHQWLLYTQEGLMFNLPKHIMLNEQGYWPTELVLNGQQRLGVTYLPPADRDWQKRSQGKSEASIRLQQQSSNTQDLSEITVLDSQNNILSRLELPEFMQLLPQPTRLNDALIGDDNNNLLQNLNGHDLLRGKGGQDVYLINDILPEGRTQGEVIIDNEDTHAIPALDVLILPWELSRIGFIYEGEDLLLYQQNIDHTNDGKAGFQVRLPNYLKDVKDERYRHLLVQNVDDDKTRLQLTVNTQGQVRLGQVEFTDNDDRTVLYHASALTTEKLFAGDGDDTVVDKSGGTCEVDNEGNRGTYFYGEAGHDNLIAKSGHNYFRGGIGNDFLCGGSGDDRYDFAAGDGQDIIEDSGGQDKLCFTNIRHDQLLFIRDNHDLVIKVAGSEDRVTIKGAFFAPGNPVMETIRSANNGSLKVSELIKAMQDILPSERVISLPGSRYLRVKDGDDRVSQLKLNYLTWEGVENTVRQLSNYEYIKQPFETTEIFSVKLLITSQAPVPVIIDRRPPVRDPACAGKVIVGSSMEKNVISVTHGNVDISGGRETDVLSVLKSGNNKLFGYEGEDVLQVTGGHNTLYGGQDSDTYRIGGDVSHAIISDEEGDNDIVSLEYTEFDVSDIKLQREGNDLLIAVAECPGRKASLVAIKNQFDQDKSKHIEVLKILGAEKRWEYSLSGLIEKMNDFGEPQKTYAFSDIPGHTQLIETAGLTRLACYSRCQLAG